MPQYSFSEKKKSRKIHLLEGWYRLTHQSWKLIQLHQGLQGRGRRGGGSSSGVPIGWVFSSETGGVTSENDGYSLSHWVFPVYLQIGDLKPVYQLALKMMAILSIKSLNA